MSKRNKMKIKNDTYILDENSPFLLKEDYKTLRTNILYSLPDTENKIIAVTSSNRADGKSTTSINLAISLGQTGHKVLLIDADLRLPSVAKRLSLTAEPGLSELLVDRCPIREALRTLPDKNITVLPSGSIPPEATRLLASEKMVQILQACRNTFDYVILDLPPVNIVSDASIVSKQVAGYLLVIKHNETEYRDVSEMVSRLSLADANIIGVVYTNLPVEGKNYYKKGYHSYYGG